MDDDDDDATNAVVNDRRNEGLVVYEEADSANTRRIMTSDQKSSNTGLNLAGTLRAIVKHSSGDSKNSASENGWMAHRSDRNRLYFAPYGTLLSNNWSESSTYRYSIVHSP